MDIFIDIVLDYLQLLFVYINIARQEGAAYLQLLQTSPGFLGTDAMLLTDINLAVQIALFMLLNLGVLAQRKAKYHLHDWIQTPVVILNLLFIWLVMVPSARFVAKEIPTYLNQTFFLIPAIHIILGSLSEIFAVYCLLAGFQILPRRIGKLRFWMWITYMFWTASVIFGIGIYLIWYAPNLLSGQPLRIPTTTDTELIGEHDGDEIDEFGEAFSPEADGNASEADGEVIAEHDADEIDEAEETAEGSDENNGALSNEETTADNETTEPTASPDEVPPAEDALIAEHDADEIDEEEGAETDLTEATATAVAESDTDAGSTSPVPTPTPVPANNASDDASPDDVNNNDAPVEATDTEAELIGEHDGDEIIGPDETSDETSSGVTSEADDSTDAAPPPSTETEGETTEGTDTAPAEVETPETEEAITDDEGADTSSPPPAAETTVDEPPLTPIAVGELSFGDEDGVNDKVILTLSNVPAPENGVYHAWLLGNEGEALDLGPLTINDGAINHTYVDLQTQNLLGLYNRVQVTIEPVDDADSAPSETIAFAGEIPETVLDHLRLMLVAAEDTPNGVGYAIGALEQIAIVRQHVRFQRQEGVSGNDPAQLRLHGEHILNIINGETSATFGDHNQDGVIENPGDGFGLTNDDGYINQTLVRALLASQTVDASPTLTEHAQRVFVTAANATDFLERVTISELELVTKAVIDDSVVNLMTTAFASSIQADQGRDANADATIDPISGEGALQAMYRQAQLMATIPIFIFSEATPAEVSSEVTDDEATILSVDETVTRAVTMPEITAEPTWVSLETTNAGPGPRYEHAMQYNATTNQIFVFGGRNGRDDYNDLWVLDLDAMTWRELAVASPVAPSPRHSTVMIVDDAAETLYIATGQGPTGNTNDVWQLDLATETWQSLTETAGPGPEARYGGPGGNLNNNLVLTHGFGATRYDTTWQFNTQTGQWENLTPSGALPLRRCLFAATPSANNLVIHGGCASGFGDCYLEDTWLLDTTTQVWRQIQSPQQPAGRQHQTITEAGNGGPILLFAGQDADQAARNDLWALDIATDSWFPVTLDVNPPVRYNHSAAWVLNSGLLVFGGRDADRAALADLWVLSLDPQNLSAEDASADSNSGTETETETTPDDLITPAEDAPADDAGYEESSDGS